jgi:hypothetical protein
VLQVPLLVEQLHDEHLRKLTSCRIVFLQLQLWHELLLPLPHEKHAREDAF